jgi:hypothetical protein
MATGSSDENTPKPAKKTRSHEPSGSDYRLFTYLRSLEVKSREAPKELAARLQREKDQADHER